MAEEKKHLPLYGVGPIIVFGQIIFTAILLFVAYKFQWNFLRVSSLRIPLAILGIVMILYGISLDLRAKFQSRLFDKVEQNELITDGVYGIVRNPVYSAALIGCTGAVIISNRPVLFFVPIICWIYMTVFLILTEEKWLVKVYGDSYSNYCKKVNRCIPWFSRK